MLFTIHDRKTGGRKVGVCFRGRFARDADTDHMDVVLDATKATFWVEAQLRQAGDRHFVRARHKESGTRDFVGSLYLDSGKLLLQEAEGLRGLWPEDLVGTTLWLRPAEAKPEAPEDDDDLDDLDDLDDDDLGL